MVNLVTVESLNAVVDTDASVIVALTPAGINDPTYFPHITPAQVGIGNVPPVIGGDGNLYNQNGNIISAGGSASWGSIGGTLSNQTDLQTALNAKVDTTSLPMAIWSQALTGLVIAPAVAVVAADSLLVAFGKLQAQINAFVNQVNVFTKAQRGQIVALTPTSNTYTPDFSAGNFFSFTPAASFTLANPTNMPSAGITQSGSFFVTQDATGSRTITFGNLYQAAGGISSITLSTTANAKDRIDYVIGAAGNIHVSIAKDVKS